MAPKLMVKRVSRMTLAELHREHELIPVWIRDVNAAKKARLREISDEIERRESRCRGRPE